MTDDLQARIGRMIADAGRELDAERPLRDAIRAHERTSRRIVLREQPYGDRSPTYRTSHIGALVFQPARTVEFTYLGESKKRTEHRSARIGEAQHSYWPAADRLADFARYPTAKALRRIEAAEEALAAAKAELDAARRAAFTYGRPVPLSAVKANTRERAAIADAAKGKTR